MEYTCNFTSNDSFTCVRNNIEDFGGNWIAQSGATANANFARLHQQTLAYAQSMPLPVMTPAEWTIFYAEMRRVSEWFSKNPLAPVDPALNTMDCTSHPQCNARAAFSKTAANKNCINKRCVRVR